MNLKVMISSFCFWEPQRSRTERSGGFSKTKRSFVSFKIIGKNVNFSWHYENVKSQEYERKVFFLASKVNEPLWFFFFTVSYKRLVPGYEAPIFAAYSGRNRSAFCRIPVSHPKGRRVEFRTPDPTCNPYLAFFAVVQAGLDGIENKIHPGKTTLLFFVRG